MSEIEKKKVQYGTDKKGYKTILFEQDKEHYHAY